MNTIDKRLLEPNGKPEIRENFNRVMQIVDEEKATGVQSISGSIDASNKLTLVFTMTDGSSYAVEGQITAPAG